MAVSVIRNITSRPFEDQADFWRIRDLLIETYPITPTGFNWDVRRWDGWRFHRENCSIKSEWRNQIRLWETRYGKLVGVAHPEGHGDFFLEVHPDYRDIEAEMIGWAEENLSAYVNLNCQVETFAFDYDIRRRQLLEQRGFEQMPYGGVVRQLRLERALLETPHIPEGYHIRTTHAVEEDCQRIADLLNAAFNRTIHTAKEYDTFMTHSPSFRHDLNLVAEAPDGSFAAHVGVTYVEPNRYGVFEPVCTHPDHQRKGLARALMLHGLRLLHFFGTTDAYVGTGDDPAPNALYESVGFTEAYHGEIWRKFC